MSARRSLRAELREIFSRYRMLLALKAAIGVVAAWLLADRLPSELAAYAYHAPLGALLGVAPTVIGSFRTTIEVVAGILLGVAVGWGLIAAGVPWFLRAPIAAGIGVLLAGIRYLGDGRVYVAIAGVFVVILGAGDPASYGLGYVVQFGLGLVVGTAVNLVFVPPLATASATSRISAVRGGIADRLDDLAEILVTRWPPPRDDWLAYARELRASVDDAQDFVDEARESTKANPRSLWHPADMSGAYADIDALRHVAVRLSDITDALSGAIWDRPVAVDIPAGTVGPLHDAMTGLAGYLRAWDSGQDVAAARDLCDRARRRAVGAFQSAAGESGLGSIVFALRTIQKRIDERTGMS